MISSGEGAENYPVFSVAGGRARNQDFTLDGGNVTNAVGVTRPQQQTSLPLDAMQEVRVIFQQLFGRVWPLDRRNHRHVHALGYQPVSRRPVRVRT